MINIELTSPDTMWAMFPRTLISAVSSAGRRVSLIGKLFADQGHDAQVAMPRL